MRRGAGGCGIGEVVMAKTKTVNFINDEGEPDSVEVDFDLVEKYNTHPLHPLMERYNG